MKLPKSASVELHVDYNGLAPDADSCIGNGEFIECYDFHDKAGANAVTLQGAKGLSRLTWRSRQPFIIFFETPDWRNYLCPIPPTIEHLYLQGCKLIGLLSYQLQSTKKGKVPYVVDVAVAPKLKATICYRFIPILPPPKPKKRRGRPGSTDSSGSSGSRATIILQD